jgi:beta-glucanase (GH16 family)
MGRKGSLMNTEKRYYNKLILILCLLSMLIFNCSRKAPKNLKTTDSKWELIWHDEFEKQQIDTSKWAHEVNAWGGGNNELQYYTARNSNSYVEQGVLTIQALKENYTGPEGIRKYTSARLRTYNKGDWRYVIIEVRARLPFGQGIWPAIWMLPSKQIYGEWAASGEIDIIELLGHEPNKIYGTLHYGDKWPNNVHSGGVYTIKNSIFSDNFHVFRLEWEPNKFKWYVDGLLFHTEEYWFTKKAEYPAPFDQPFHLILSVAVGGNWPKAPDSTTIFPQKMYIDYVRVYKKNE